MSFVITYTDDNNLAMWQLFETEEEAKGLIGSLIGYTVRPPTWQERERLRRYPPLPWAAYLDRIPDHWAHVSTTDPTQIAFTENAAKGERDIQTRMRPGRYLQRYYPDLTPKQVAFYAEWFRTGQQPPPQIDGELQINTQFVYAYKVGPSSCMKDMDCVRVYDAGDLQIAYVENNETVISRTIVWPKRKLYGRIYPDPGCYDEGADLQRRLRDLGYRDLEESEVGFHGARILKIPESGTFVMPYMDRGYGVKDAGDHFVMSLDYEYPCDTTSGYIEEDERPVCDNCYTPTNEDDMWSGIHCLLGEKDLCTSCYNELGGFMCEVTHEYYAEIEPVEFTHTNGRVLTATQENRDEYYRETPSGWCHMDDAVKTPYGLVYRYGTFVCPITGKETLYSEGVLIDDVWVARTNQEQAA